MLLEIHDSEVGNSHVASVKNIDYDYMAEQWVQDAIGDEAARPQPSKFPLREFILKDDQGIRATWQIHENLDVELVHKSERFTGEWVLNHRFTPRR